MKSNKMVSRNNNSQDGAQEKELADKKITGEKKDNNIDTINHGTQKAYKDYNVHIIGNKSMNNELVSYYLKQSDLSFRCDLHTSLAISTVKIEKGINNLVLCNCRDINEHDQPNACGRHISTVPSDCSWICFNVPHDPKIAQRAISKGVHGIFYEDDSLSAFTKGIKAIINGELWYSRETLSAALSGLVEKNNTHIRNNSDKVKLTKREKEILKLVALGKTNEEIADLLIISTLTVKTHVSNIYHKLNVPNRIQAILWATSNLVHLKD